MILEYFLDVSPLVRRKARAALEILLDGLGAAGREVYAARDADLVYAPVPPIDNQNCALWIASSVAVRSSAESGAHPADVVYDAADPEIVRAMQESIEAGWEIGLHASINCAHDPGRFSEEKAILERLIGHPVRGVRHHYWNLGNGLEQDTWLSHKGVGLDYDSSLGANDSAGFRRGLATMDR